MIKSIFKNLCPNCKGDIEVERLYKGLPCEKCLPSEKEGIKEGDLKLIYEVEGEILKWSEHFEKCIGSPPWNLQITWAKRVFLKHSFGLLAPTGVGKTSFGLCMASYLATKNKNSYIILPTKLLVEQTFKKLKDFGLSEKEVLYFLEESKKEKEKKRERLKNKDFLILLTTSMFLYKNYKDIPREFEFLFVDDVDSFLKTAKNIDKALYLLGFSENDINLAMNLIRMKEKPKKNEKDWEEIARLQENLKDIKEKKKEGVLVVSSATSNPKSNRIKLFRELLGFEVGTPVFYLRNVVDAYSYLENDKIENWIKKLGNGGILFIPSDKGKEFVYEIKEYLEKRGIKSLTYEEINEEGLKKFESGEINLLIGIASYKNPLARGIDLPYVIRYALFYGVPKIVLSLKFEKNLTHLLWAIVSLRAYIIKKFPHYAKNLDRWITQIKKYQYLEEEFIESKPEIKMKIDALREEIGKFLNSDEIINLLIESEEVTIRKEEDGYKMVVSDATGYLQASGRTSRMYAGGITKGLSFLLIDDKRAFNHLVKKIRWFSDDINFINYEKIDLNEILKEIDEDREKVKNFMQGKITIKNKSDILKPVLIVVESPNKARTIAGFFGEAIKRKVKNHEVLETSALDKYIMITASFGHILDLNKQEGYYGVYVDDKIKPIYEVIEGKEEIIEGIRYLAFEGLEVFVATDPDTEGEKIGWDIFLILKPYVKDIKRMEFHEVTKKAILKALKEPRDFNENLVKAQIVRRISDRWVGFEFSHLLWKEFGKTWLSAGRVQTPVLGWIIERERETRERIYKVIINLEKEGKKFKIEFVYENKREGYDFFKKLEEIEIIPKGEKEEIKNPLPPYRTDTLLKDASDRYRFSLPKTMEIAQTLFELGFITYHRTDSIRVSDAGIQMAKEYIEENFGKEYFYARTWGEGGAHECIRPTKLIEPEDLKSLILSGQYEGLNFEHVKIYELIFKRFIASQIKPIKLIAKEVKIKGIDREIDEVIYTKIVEDGWNKILSFDLNPDIIGKIDVRNIKKFREHSKAYPFTHGELVFRMKERGIGRPSTYATIIEKLLERKYVIEKNGFLMPTPLGKKIYFYLNKKEEIKKFLSEDFTRTLEELMDKVELGEKDYEKILKELFNEIKNIY